VSVRVRDAEPPTAGGVRLAELVCVLSLGTDLGLGQPMEHMLRQCRIALRLAEGLGVRGEERVVVYYTALLAWVGCHVDAREQARWLGDDLALKGDFRLIDADARGEAGFVLRHLGAGRPPLDRLRLGLAFAGEGRRVVEDMFENHWRATEALARSLDLPLGVLEALPHTFDRWDGRGLTGARGEAIARAARLVTLSDVVEIVHRTAGAAAAVAVARDRSGTQFDPAAVERFAQDAPRVFADLEAAASWDAVVDAEPGPERHLPDARLDPVLEAIGDFADLKCPFLLGHSRAVGTLAADAAALAGAAPREVRAVRRAGFVHDLGRLGVPNTIWDARRTLGRGEWERIRLHPYLTERMLAGTPALAPLGRLASMHAERLDGSGYPRGLRGDAIPREARLLAAADVFCALVEDRPHRPARTAAEAARILREEAGRGRLDGVAVEAVLRAAGQPAARRPAAVAGLTPREVEVLGLVARGLSNREIAERLVISRKTAGNHVASVYAKARIRNRAQASVFAMSHGLLRAEDGANASWSPPPGAA